MRTPDRFYLLDALRGLAALTVVGYHWQNFLVIGEVQTANYRGRGQPFFEFLRLVYERGFLAVDLFFSLSGFIFFCLYSVRVAQGQLSGSRFALLRFSRLFPLHLATLLLATVFQALFLSSQGRHFAYIQNDAYHFALHLPLLSSVGLEHGLGFNAPVWSVSVEVGLYLMFFGLCRAGLTRPWSLVLLALLGLVVLAPIYQPLGRGVTSFLLGGLAFHAYQHLGASANRQRMTVVIFWLVGFLWVATLVAFYAWPLQTVPLLWRLDQRFATLLLFPLTIVALALVDTGRPDIGKPLAPLGDVSYSSYLLHFPLQMAFALAVSSLGLPTTLFESGATMAFFLIVLLVLAWASHRFFEMPAQHALRKWWRKQIPVS